MTRRYRHVEDGEPRKIPMEKGVFAHKTMCCDCGLVHIINLKPLGPRTLEMRAWRDRRATAARRRRRRPRSRTAQAV